MRLAFLTVALLLAGCVVTPPDASYDPHLYDANGQVIGPAGAPPPPPPPSAPLPCREFERTVTIDGAPTVAHGTACRNPDGTWHTVQ